MTQMRFLQVFDNGGSRGVFDLWTQLSDWSWYSVYRHLNYGQLTDFIQVPNGTGSNTIIWFVPAGADPAMYEVSMTDSMNFHIAASDTGKHTIFSYFVGSPSDWAHMMVADADPRLTPPSGYAHVAGSGKAIRGSLGRQATRNGVGCRRKIPPPGNAAFFRSFHRAAGRSGVTSLLWLRYIRTHPGRVRADGIGAGGPRLSHRS